MQQVKQSEPLQLSKVEQTQRDIDTKAAKQQIATLITNLEQLNVNCKKGQHQVVIDNYRFIEKWINPKSQQFITKLKQFDQDLQISLVHESTLEFYSILSARMNEFYQVYELLYQQYYAYEDRKDVYDSDKRQLKLLSQIIS